MIQEVKYHLVSKKQEKETPFLFYKFKTNRGLNGNVIYKVLNESEEDKEEESAGSSSSSSSSSEETPKKEEETIVKNPHFVVHMIDVSDCSVFSKEKYCLSASALLCSMGKSSEMFSEIYDSNIRKEI